MDVPSMDTIYQAISALYDNPNASEKEKASLWLAEVQKSIHSWKIADELLQQKKDLNSCYFAAQTMRTKVQHNLSELPQDSLISLRDSLIVHLEHTTPDTSSSILTQLCLALAALALQMPTWQNCVSDLIKLLSNKSSIALLEILTVLPQEVDSTSLRLGENRRDDIKAELRSSAPIVTMFLKEHLNNSQSTQVALKIVKCMTAWIQVRAINIQEVPQNAVIGFCLQVLKDQNSINTLHDAASDCICALLQCLEQTNYEDIDRLLYESVASLEENYHMAVAHEEDEKATNYARLFTELGETFLQKIVASAGSGTTHFAVRSLELALVCVGHHDYEVAEITFNLWYRLSEEIYNRDYEPLMNTFKPHIERLIEALARHCQCEPDHTQLPDDEDEFSEFRDKVMGLIKDVVFIVGSSFVFRQMFTVLHADMSWEQTEAALFVMQCVAKNILPDEYEYVPKVVEAILSMPEGTHPAVRKTCILLLGELCEWIERHPECLEPCLQCLIRALQNKQLAHAAATALQNICKACRVHTAQHAPTLLQAARLADELGLPLHTASALMRAVAASIGTLPHDQLTAAMREAIAVQVSGLSELLKSGKEVRKGTVTDPVLFLDRMSALFRDVDVPPSSVGNRHPCVPAFCDAWPVLEQVMEKWCMDGRVMERACRVVRFGARACGRGATGLAPALAARLGAVYSARAHSCVLYVAGVLLDELYAEREAAIALHSLLRLLLPSALALLQRPGGLADNPDTVDDLFRLCIRFLQRTPQEFLSSEAMSTVIQCALLASALDHREANSSVMKFLYDLAKLANSRQPENQECAKLAGSVLSLYGEALTRALVQASALQLHAYMLGDVAEVLLELLQWQRGRGLDWLLPALQALPRERAAAATDPQCYQFHHYAWRAEKCKEITRLLRDFARLYQ